MIKWISLAAGSCGIVCFGKRWGLVMQLDWAKPFNGPKWNALAALNVGGITVDGIYMIWFEASQARVVCVGNGRISRELARERNDREVIRYADRGTLLVTWAALPTLQQEGAVRYLTDLYPPLIKRFQPGAVPVAVNSPWR